MDFLLLLLLQIVVIILVSRLIGLGLRLIQQPQVVSDMIAGIILGPSLLGWLAPTVSAHLFPPESLPHLNTLAQVGLVLFMFLVGLEFDTKLLRGRGHAAIITSHVSIIAPFLLGTILAYFLYPQLSDSSVGFVGFSLFLSASMSVTAFPVLARILQERKLLNTRVGAVTIACAAVDDVTAWAILAMVIALVRSSALKIPLWVTVVGSITFIVTMIFLVRPALRTIERFYTARGHFSQNIVALILVVILTAAWTTEFIGIHALFGAFCTGAIMPKDRAFVHELNGKLEYITVILLLPIFFANAGLHTSIGLISGIDMWFFLGLIMFTAVGGKFGGSTIAARITGLGWRESTGLGILMNTRGLMELVILTIGLELGVISPALFAMMIIMALLTTFMTTPTLHWLYPIEQMRKMESETAEERDFSVLIPVSLPSSGPGMLEIARALIPSENNAIIYGVHLLRHEDVSLTDLSSLAQHPSPEAVLQPLSKRADEYQLPFHPLVFSTDRSGRDIADLAYIKNARLIILGWQKPVLSKHILGGTVHDVLSRAQTDVAVFVQRHFEDFNRIIVPFQNPELDMPALQTALQIAQHQHVPLHILQFTEHTTEPNPELTDLQAQIHIITATDPTSLQQEILAFNPFDLIVVGLEKLPATLRASYRLRHENLISHTPASLLIWRGH